MYYTVPGKFGSLMGNMKEKSANFVSAQNLRPNPESFRISGSNPESFRNSGSDPDFVPESGSVPEFRNHR